MERYDPNRQPNVTNWRARDQEDAYRLVRAYHASPHCEHPPAPNPRLHAWMHVVVENQIALGKDTPVAATIERLTAEGLSRHDAVHAVGSVLAEQVFRLSKSGWATTEVPSEAYYEALRTLTAESWLQSNVSGEPEATVRVPAEMTRARRHRQYYPRSDESTSFAHLSDDALIGLLFTEGDQLPRAAVDQIMARRSRTTTALIAVVIDPRNWGRPVPDWWAPIHATFILGAIDDPIADTAILSAMRDADALDYDWITEAMPCILGGRGERIAGLLAQIAADRREEPLIRATALRALAATTLRGVAKPDDVWAAIGDVLTDPNEDPWLRGSAGNILLDFQIENYRSPLVAFAREEASRASAYWPAVLPFSEEDVTSAFSTTRDLDVYQRDWLRFYDADQITARQARWAREDAKRDGAPTPRGVRIKIGRNDPCPCGSGKKYKKCCLGRDGV